MIFNIRIIPQEHVKNTQNPIFHLSNQDLSAEPLLCSFIHGRVCLCVDACVRWGLFVVYLAVEVRGVYTGFDYVEQ